MKKIILLFVLILSFTGVFGQYVAVGPKVMAQDIVKFSYDKTTLMFKDLNVKMLSYVDFNNAVQSSLNGTLPAKDEQAIIILAIWLGDCTILGNAAKKIPQYRKVHTAYEKITKLIIPEWMTVEKVKNMRSQCGEDLSCLTATLENARIAFVRSELSKDPGILLKLVKEYRKLP